ncbi:MAG: tetraacyldisaccharide 4'-kinase, partial [Pseudorhodoplanes sp.]
MREPSFWWQEPGLAAWVLSPAGFVYGAVAGRRMQKAGTPAGIPVVCVGNFTLGGTGKTPAALAIADILMAAGEHPYFLTRGYGGTRPGPLEVEPARHRASDTGDEPLLL